MDRRLAAIAGAVLAGAGALGMLSRRHAAAPEGGIPSPADPIQAEPVAAPASASAPLGPEHAIFLPEPGQPSDLDTLVQAAAADPVPQPSPFYGSEEPAPARPLADVLADLVSSYPVDAGRMLDLRLALREAGDAIEAGTLAEATVVVDFDWIPGPGLLMNMAISVLATREYVRINFADTQGNLRAPELDVYIREGDVRIVPDATARTVDLDERRSEATVTRAKLRAHAQGIAVHPGDAASVLARCRIVRSAFPA